MAGDGTEQLIDENGKRLDGRNLNEYRPTSIKVGILENADGSAEIRQGKNIIVAAIYGPRELHPKHLALPDRALVQCFYRMATFSVDERKSPAPSRREREISKILSDALQSVVLAKRYPRTTIDVYVQVLQASGGTRCASLTAAAVALADAGVPMRGIIAGIASGLANDKVVLDLANIEDQKGGGDLPVGYAPALDEISLLQLDGIFTIEQFEEAVNTAINGCEQIYELQKDALKKVYSSIRAEVADEDEDEEESKQIIEESLKDSSAVVEGDEYEDEDEDEDEDDNPTPVSVDDVTKAVEEKDEPENLGKKDEEVQ